MAEHAADVRQKPHVEHAVRLVEHEILEAAELRVRLPEVIEKTARRADDDVDAAAERVLLRPHADAAIHGRAAVSGVCTARSFRSSTICAASSRVGVSTSARVVPRGLSISLWRIGSRNAAVLPLPVIAQASRS